MPGNRQIIVRELPKGALTEAHFALREADRPVPGEGEVLLRTILMSIDAANRAWMQGATYREAVKAGDVMHTYAIGEVVESQDASLAPGDLVAAEARWAEYVTLKARRAQKLPRLRPLSQLLSVYGIAGKTAYHGLIGVGRPQAGETVVVSAAAGSVGMYVGQIAKALGCRAVGIAGGADKCAYVVKELGFDACIDYKAHADSKSLYQALKGVTPDGVDGYFENVGGTVLDAVLPRMNAFGRIALCGMISGYNGVPIPLTQPQLILQSRLRIEGFIVSEHTDDWPAALKELGELVASAKLKYRETVAQGIEEAPRAFLGLLAGRNFGKQLVKLI